MEEEIEIKELINIFWKKKFVIIFITIIFGVAGAFYALNYKVPKYKSSTTLLLAQNYSEQNIEENNEITQMDVVLNQKLVSTYSELVKSKTIIKQVLENLGMNIQLENEIKRNIEVEEVKDTQVIEITFINENPEISYKVANELSIVFCQKIKEIYNINNVYVVDNAEMPTAPYNINHLKDILIFAILGMGLSCFGVFIVSLFDTTVKTQEDVEKNTGLNVLAQVPEIKIGGKK